MTVTCEPSAFVTCTSYAASAFELSFSVVARSAVPPTFAMAAAVAFAATSPVSGVSGACPVRVVVVAVVVVLVFELELAAAATVAPARAEAPSAATPSHVLHCFFMHAFRRLRTPQHAHLGKS